MLSTNLSTVLKPYKALINRAALSKTFQCLQLSPGKVLGCSTATILETNADHGLMETVYIDATTFLLVMDSLPDGKEVKLSVTDDVLHWECGSARGRLATMLIDDMPKFPKVPTDAGAWTPTKDFVTALRLGALSADSNALLSIGMYGVVIDNRGPLVIMSSDNVTISACTVGDVKLPGPDIITLTPEPAALLADLIQTESGTLEFTSDAVFYEDKYCRYFIKQVPPLRYDSLEQLNKFLAATMVAGIGSDAVHSFVKRAGALAENRRHTYIALEASDGQLALSFEEGVASADEFYLVKDLMVGTMPPIQLDAAKLARVLPHITEVVLDHITSRGALVMRGHSPEFSYLIGGRTQAGQAVKPPAPAAPGPDPTPAVATKGRRKATV